MRKRIPKILVTGGAGFIGSAFVRRLSACPYPRYKLVVLDKLTYAGEMQRLEEVKRKYDFYKADICNERVIKSIFCNERPEIVVNFAAQTHVDRSIINSAPFLKMSPIFIPVNLLIVLKVIFLHLVARKFLQTDTIFKLQAKTDYYHVYDHERCASVPFLSLLNSFYVLLPATS